jgi:crotonobetainyl-CoA:carnitine CoA-transferase CaiB-like acyl-CoA transferase
LASLRVLDVGGADSHAVSRLFGDLGADVLRIELPGGAADRVARPTVAGTGVAFALQNANKRSAMLHAGSATDRDRFIKLAGEADILIDCGNPAALVAYHHRLRCGRGDSIDFSRFEAVVQSLDPPSGLKVGPLPGRRRQASLSSAAVFG